jgi:hypothetical protein
VLTHEKHPLDQWLICSGAKENQINNFYPKLLSWRFINVNYDQISCSAVNATSDSIQGSKEKQEATILADKVKTLSFPHSFSLSLFCFCTWSMGKPCISDSDTDNNYLEFGLVYWVL